MTRGRRQVLRLRPGADLRRSLDRFATRPGHLLERCRIRTTAEILIELLDDVRLLRRRDPDTGYRELVPRTFRTGSRRR